MFKRKNNSTIIWIHASSIGECKVGYKIINKITNKYKNIKFIFSITTLTGYEYLKKTIKKKATIILAPIDFHYSIQKILSKIKPNLIILIETEIWPNWINLAHKLGIKIIVINGKISKKSFKNYKKIQFFIKPVLSKINKFSMSSHEDMQRIIKIGAPKNKVYLGGNIKFDINEKEHNKNIKKKIRKLYKISKNQLVIVAGSIRTSEEIFIIKTYQKIKKFFPKIILIIAPRHIERAIKLKKILTFKNIPVCLKREIKKKSFRKENIIILDSIGELFNSYSIANIVFCGGSLVNLGGQNIIEPCSWAKPVIFGPYMDDFKEISNILKKYKSAIQIKNFNELSIIIIYLLNNPLYSQKIGFLAQKIIKKNSETAIKHYQLIEEYIEKFNQKL